jgi:adenylate cyclase
MSELHQNSKLWQSLIIGLASTVLASLLHFTGVLNPWELKTWDKRVQLLAKTGAATDSIRLILLDQNSLDWALEVNGLTWPWPRQIYGAIIDFCTRCDIKVFAMDVLFTEPSSYGVEDDLLFGEAIARAGNFVNTVFLSNQSGSVTTWPSSVPVTDIQLQNLANWAPFTTNPAFHYSRAVFPISEIANNAALLANVQLPPDADAIFRRIQFFTQFDRRTVPTLGIAAYLAGHSQTPLSIRKKTLQIGAHSIPLDRDGYGILNFRGPTGTHKSYSAAAILQAEIQFLSGESSDTLIQADLNGKYVFFGFSAPGLFDLRPTPVGGAYTGVEIHATLLDNFLSGDFIQTVSIPVVIILVLLLATISALVINRFNHPAVIALIILICIILPVALVIIGYQAQLWLPLIVQELAIIVAIAGTVTINYATEGQQKRFIKNAFRQYLSPTVIDELIQHPERLKLGGESRILSIFFSDLQGFTTISEGLSPEDLTTFLNDYLSAMTDIIQEEGGTVDKYEGDAIIAFWNAPLAVSDHADRAVQAALRCQAKLSELRPEFKSRVGQEVYMRIGLNTGSAVVGNMGSHTRFDYTMLGDAVNLAARLEGVNKQFGTYTLMSQSTYEKLSQRENCRDIARIQVVGRKTPVTVYEPFLKTDFDRNQDIFLIFAEGLSHFYSGNIAKAKLYFEQIQNQDSVSARYLMKCKELIDYPPQEWRGIWILSEK